MDSASTNPLAKHFRTPAIYFKLPSKGTYWPADALDYPENGDIPVYPMTNADEITLKTPDALLNGTGIVNVIQSCCPNIKNAWKMPSIDVDATLIAIRVASYGQRMSVSTACPNCKEELEFQVDLTGLTDRIKSPDYSTPLLINGLKIKLRPQEYFSVTQAEIAKFEEEKILQSLSDTTIDDNTRASRVRDGVIRMVELKEALMVSATEYIETEDGTQVADQKYIAEFYKNVGAGFVKTIETRLEEYSIEAAVPPLDIKCNHCGTDFQTPLEFDYSRFFG